MSAEDELKEAVGELSSGRGPRPAGVGIPIGSSDPADKVLAVEADLRKLYDALFVLARQIDDLRSQIVGR
jgi:hypothetical protein